MKCSKCKEGEVKKVTIEKYQARLKGISFPVDNAEIEKCDSCDAELYSAKEIRRWEQLLDEHLITSGLILSPTQISSIRENLGLNVLHFAKLLGVTRQSVYGWENDNAKPLSIGPTSLLLSLLLEEKSGKIDGIVDFLVKSAKARGIDLPKTQDDKPNYIFPKNRLRTLPTGSPGFCV